MLDDLKDHFGSFIEKYVADSFTRTELLEELAEYISACESGGTHAGSKISKDAFSVDTLKKYMLNMKRWWELNGRKLKHLQRLVCMRIARCKPSSSSAERNWSIWGIVQT